MKIAKFTNNFKTVDICYTQRTRGSASVCGALKLDGKTIPQPSLSLCVFLSLFVPLLSIHKLQIYYIVYVLSTPLSLYIQSIYSPALSLSFTLFLSLSLSLSLSLFFSLSLALFLFIYLPTPTWMRNIKLNFLQLNVVIFSCLDHVNIFSNSFICRNTSSACLCGRFSVS